MESRQQQAIFQISINGMHNMSLQDVYGPAFVQDQTLNMV